MHNQETVREKETHKLHLDFFYTNGSTNLRQLTRFYNSQQKKRTSRTVDFSVSADHRVKLKENEKKDK